MALLIIVPHQAERFAVDVRLDPAVLLACRHITLGGMAKDLENHVIAAHIDQPVFGMSACQ